MGPPARLRALPGAPAVSGPARLSLPLALCCDRRQLPPTSRISSLPWLGCRWLACCKSCPDRSSPGGTPSGSSLVAAGGGCRSARERSAPWHGAGGPELTRGTCRWCGAGQRAGHRFLSALCPQAGCSHPKVPPRAEPWEVSCWRSGAGGTWGSGPLGTSLRLSTALPTPGSSVLVPYNASPWSHRAVIPIPSPPQSPKSPKVLGQSRAGATSPALASPRHSLAFSQNSSRCLFLVAWHFESYLCSCLLLQLISSFTNA